MAKEDNLTAEDAEFMAELEHRRTESVALNAAAREAGL